MTLKDIQGYEGIYQISSTGIVKKLAQLKPLYKGQSHLKEKILKQDITKRNHTSYARVTLCYKGKTERISVHRLVATHFIPNPHNKPHINHIDNNGLNNCVDNLEWCTHSENMIHAHKQNRLCGTEVLRKHSEKVNLNTELTFKALLGDNFINLYKIDAGSRKRTYIQYRCKSCFQVADARNDNPRLKLCLCSKCI